MYLVYISVDINKSFIYLKSNMRFFHSEVSNESVEYENYSDVGNLSFSLMFSKTQ